MKNYRTAGVALALLFLLLLLGALGLRVWASGKSAETIGPDHIAVSQDRVYVHVNGELFVLSALGKILERKNIEPLVHDTSLIDLRAMQNGRLLLARQQPAGIEVCDTQSWQCEPLGQAATAKIKSQFKVLVDEHSQALYVTDSGSLRIWSTSLADGEVRPLIEENIFRRPNDIAMDTDGHLWIADSGNHRIVSLARKNDGAWTEVNSHSADNKLTRDQRDWPMMLALAADGNWWVTQPTKYGGNGDLLVYHPEQGVRSRVELPEYAYPTDLTSLGQDMLVTDMDRFKIYRIDSVTHALNDFGDDAFRALMGQGKQRKARYLAVAEYSLFVMIPSAALMILAAFWASPKEKRWTAPAAAPLSASTTPAPRLKEIYWLRRNPATERSMRWMRKPVFYAIPVIMILLCGGMYYFVLGVVDASGMTPEKQAKLDELETALLALVFFTAALSIAAITLLPRLQHRLGTDGQRLFVNLATGRQLSFVPHELVYNVRQIAYQGYVFLVQTGHGLPLYETNEINTYIAPLLNRAKKLGRWDMFRYQLGHREPVLVTNLVLTIMLAAMMLASGQWRHILPGW